MKFARASVIFVALLTPGVCSAQERDALGQWTPYFRVGQMFIGDTVVAPGKITFDNKLTLTIGSTGVIIPKYKLFSERVRATAYPLYGDATHIILRNNYTICRGKQPKWIVFVVTYNKVEHWNELNITLSMEDPRNPTSSDDHQVAEEACAQIFYVPGTMQN